MSDRVSASITIGGSISASDFAILCQLIQNEGLSIDWSGDPFEPEQWTDDEPLRLGAHEVPWGEFDELEEFCRERGLPYARWFGAFGSEWNAGRAVFTGAGKAVVFESNEADQSVLDEATLRQLGNFEAALAYFSAANFTVPPLRIA